MPIEAPNAVPGLESKDEATKITKTKLEDKIDPFKVIINIELVNKLRTISPAAAPTTQDSSAETSKATVHTAPRATEDIDKVAKTNGKESSHKEKIKILKTNNNINVGFMDVKETVKNIEIHDKENNQVQEFLFTSRPLLVSRFPPQSFVVTLLTF